MTVIHVDFGSRRTLNGPHVIPAELLDTLWRQVTWMYWNASRAAIASYQRGSPDGTAVRPRPAFAATSTPAISLISFSRTAVSS